MKHCKYVVNKKERNYVMREFSLILMLIIVALLRIIDKQKQKNKILENNWETAKIVIKKFDPKFAEYINETHK